MVLELLKLNHSELSILLTDDAKIALLNETFRGKKGPTDVLSFPNGEKVGKRLILGDVVISVDTARRQARDLGRSLKVQILRLLVHGIVHLMGYDHERGGEEERRFKDLERYLLSQLVRC